MRISTLSLFIALTIIPLVHGYWGTMIMGWLNSVGIKYVPPVVLPTCTDCSRGRSPRVSSDELFRAQRIMQTIFISAWKTFLGNVSHVLQILLTLLCRNRAYATSNS